LAGSKTVKVASLCSPPQIVPFRERKRTQVLLECEKESCLDKNGSDLIWFWVVKTPLWLLCSSKELTLGLSSQSFWWLIMKLVSTSHSHVPRTVS